MTSLKSSAKLKAFEEDNQDAMMVFLSDVWLDHPRVTDKLRVLFAGYSEVPPVCFILMGNFLSTSQSAVSADQLRKHLRLLAEMIREFPNLANQSHFIFVPGPNDPGLANILPR